jgi:hypothetical protein
MNTTKSGTTSEVLPAARTLEGAGFLVHRPSPARGWTDPDPFLLLDEMGPMELGPKENRIIRIADSRPLRTWSPARFGARTHRDIRGY